MRTGLDQLNAAVEQFSKAVGETQENWRGSAQTEFMNQYDSNIKPKLEKDVPGAIDGLISFVDNFLKNMIEADNNAAEGMRG